MSFHSQIWLLWQKSSGSIVMWLMWAVYRLNPELGYKKLEFLFKIYRLLLDWQKDLPLLLNRLEALQVLSNSPSRHSQTRHYLATLNRSYVQT